MVSFSFPFLPVGGELPIRGARRGLLLISDVTGARNIEL
jgi:hypothetical protein